jgi:hypothetical protein
VWDPLRHPTTLPPMIPSTIPDNIGAFEAKAIPRQSGKATKKTTRPAIMSRPIDRRGKGEVCGLGLIGHTR